MVKVGAIVCLLAVCVVQALASCSGKASGYFYDLSELQSSKFYLFGGGVASYDRYHRGHSGEKYLYFINLCKDVNRPAVNESSCDEKPDSPALQVTKESRYHPPVCYALASTSATSWELIDEDPANGVRLKYGGGEECFKRSEVVNATGHTNIEWHKVDREFWIDFTCDPNVGNEISDWVNLQTEHEALVHEEPQCVYRLTFPTRHTCGYSSAKPTAPSSYTPSSSSSGGGLGFFSWFFILLIIYVCVMVFTNWPRAMICFAKLQTGYKNPLVLKSVAFELLVPAPLKVKLGGAGHAKTAEQDSHHDGV